MQFAVFWAQDGEQFTIQIFFHCLVTLSASKVQTIVSNVEVDWMNWKSTFNWEIDQDATFEERDDWMLWCDEKSNALVQWPGYLKQIDRNAGPLRRKDFMLLSKRKLGLRSFCWSWTEHGPAQILNYWAITGPKSNLCRKPLRQIL